MSCSSCTKTPAKHDECFNRMSDGRAFTNWTPNCSVYSQQVDNPNKGSSYDQRMYLINNAEKLMNDNKNSLPNGACVPCFANNEVGTMLPEQDMQTCSKNFCTYTQNNSTGLGLGRKYN